ncbi:MAG TPA: P-loop NTPase fold protein [Solirubrobacterales bacterium]|nr:P-loop NTPase fold protein [Solirubrobacterales bacterium]
MDFKRSGTFVRLSSDAPITDAEDDYFGFATFATALAEIIDNEETGTPLTIALSAPWGAGKTSVARMIERDLAKRVADRKGDSQRIICQFNAWEHDDAPHLGAALAASVARVANRRRRWWRRLVEPLPAAMLEPKQRWGRVLLLGIFAAALTAVLVAITPTRHLAEDFLKPKEAAAGIFGLLWLGSLLWGVLYKAGRNATRFIDNPGSEAARGAMAEVRGQLGKLIKQATRGGRLVIFVDDLERCRPARAVEVFEVASQLLSHKGVVTILLADMRSLEEAAKAAYQDDAGGSGDPGIGRRYLEKLVQLELQLPPPAVEDMKLLLSGKRPSGASADEGEKPEPDARDRSFDRYEAVWTVAGVAGFIALIGGSVAGGIAGVTSYKTLALFLAIAIMVLIGAIGTLWVAVDRRRRRRVADRVLATLRENPSQSSDDPDDELLRAAAGEERYKPLAKQLFESARTVESSEVEAVESFIRRYPPQFPRGAKRMLNHARLLTKIAREREMLDADLTPEHLGKWIVLGERWPEFAQRVAQRPSLIRKIETPRSVDLPVPDLPADESGETDREFTQLVKGEPKLGAVVERLIYFQPAPPAEATPPVSRSAAPA